MTSLPRARNAADSSIMRSRCDTLPVIPTTAAGVSRSTLRSRSSAIVTFQSDGIIAATVGMVRSASDTARTIFQPSSTSRL